MVRCALYAGLFSLLFAVPGQLTAQESGYPVVPASAAMSAGPGPVASHASGRPAFGRSWGSLSPQDWGRFYHYPYVYYPHNFWGNNYYRSSDSLYYRYPSEMRIPVYNKKWHNYYPSARPYHKGHHFVLDVF